MEYKTPQLLTSYFVPALYGDGSGFSSSCPDGPTDPNGVCDITNDGAFGSGDSH